MSLEELVDGGRVERCLHQVFRPKHHWSFITPPTKGDCTVCEYDPDNNPRCSGFVPVGFVTRRIVKPYGKEVVDE